jgi:Ankyrin repeats (3 copies)/Domain of unknown function (DUF3471)
MRSRRSLLPFASFILLVIFTIPAMASQTPSQTEKAEAFAAAARKGDAATVTKLLDEGVDVNTKFRYGATALSFAADHGQLEVVKVLLARGANVNVKDTFYGATPLTWAVSPALTRKPEHAEIVGLLLKHGAEGKEDALMSAVSDGDAPTTKIILAQGGFKPEQLADALDIATRAKRPEIISLLEAVGAKPPPELKLDEMQLARYAGTYLSAGGAELVIAVAGGRLTIGAGKTGVGPGQPLSLVPRDETTFIGAESAQLRVTFTIENGAVTAMTIGPPGGGTRYAKQ